MAFDLWQSHLSLALAIFLLFPAARWSRGRQLLLLAALLAGTGVSVHGLAIAAYPRSIIGELSSATMLWMTYAVLVQLRLVPAVKREHRVQIVILFGALGLILYPATLGLIQFDPYRLGYDPHVLLGLIAACVAALLYWQNQHAACLLAAATLAFVAHVQASGNYWDYLLDPFIVLFCWGVLVRCSCKRIRALARSVGQQRALARSPLVE